MSPSDLSLTSSSSSIASSSSSLSPSSMPTPKKIPLPHKVAVAAIAGISGTSVVYPLDIIKSNIQMIGSFGGKSSISVAVDVTKSIIRSNGIRGLYRGFGACLVGIAPEKAIKLAVNDTMRDYLGESAEAGLSLGKEILAGSIAGALQLVVTVPYEHVKIRLQMSVGKTASEVVRDLGPIGLYRGFTATLCRDVPFCLLFFPLYANLKAWQSSSTVREPFYIGLTSGIVAGAISGGLVTPADMLKTRIQMGKAEGFSLLGYARHVAKTEGISTLYRGWQQRMAVIAPLYGLVSLAYEVQKRWLAS